MDEEIDLETHHPTVISNELETAIRELNQIPGVFRDELDEASNVDEDATDALTEPEQICSQENYFQPLQDALHLLNQAPSTNHSQQNEAK